jgi:hypothetical protein
MKLTFFAILTVLAVDALSGDILIEFARSSPYGIIGLLLGWFVWWSRKDKLSADTRLDGISKQMYDIVEKQTKAIEEHAAATREYSQTIQKQTAVLEELVEILDKRPCLHSHIKALD